MLNDGRYTPEIFIIAKEKGTPYSLNINRQMISTSRQLTCAYIERNKHSTNEDLIVTVH